MWERMIITLIIGLLIIGMYLLFNARQRRKTTAINRKTSPVGQARLLYFRSEACAACAAQARYLESLDAEFQLFIEPIDVDQKPEMAGQYNILSLPTTLLIDDSGVVQYINYGLTNPFKLTRQLEEITMLKASAQL